MGRTKIDGIAILLYGQNANVEIRRCYDDGVLTDRVMLTLNYDHYSTALAGHVVSDLIADALNRHLPEGSWTREIVAGEYIFFVKTPTKNLGDEREPVEWMLGFLSMKVPMVKVKLR